MEKITFKPLVWTKMESNDMEFHDAGVDLNTLPEEFDYTNLFHYSIQRRVVWPEHIDPEVRGYTYASRCLPGNKEWESKTGDIEELKRLCEEDYQKIMNRVFHEIQKLRS